MPNSQDLLDWTFADIPEASANLPSGLPPRPPQPRATPRPSPLPWQAWAGVGLLVGVVLLCNYVYQAWEAQRVRQEVVNFVTAQEQMLLARDSAAYSELLDPAAPPAWRAQQINRLLGNIPYLPILPGFSPTFAPPQLQHIQAITATLWQVEKAYTFYTLDGSPATFVYTEFYRYHQARWWHSAPPAEWSNPALQVWQGRFLELHYPTPDAALITTLGPELDALLGQVCEHWQCPVDLKLVRSFSTEPDATPYPQQYAPRDSSFILTLRQSPFSAASDFVSPSLYGYPADAASHAWYRRALAAVLLDDLARELTHNTRNAFIHALAIREAARLGIEPPELLELEIATDLFAPDDLWAAGLFGWPGYSAPQQALALLNRTLRDQPAEVDYRLMRALKPPYQSEANTAHWLAASMGISPEAAASRLATAAVPPALALLTQTPGDLVLQCPTGLQMWNPTAPITLTPVLAAPFAHLGTQPMQWSPNGQQLAVLAAGRPALLNFETGAATWLPGHFFPDSTELQWISNTVLAYTSYVGENLRQYPNQQWRFWDAAQALTLPLTLRGVAQYLPAPDGTRAAVLEYPETSQPNLWASLMPTLGGQRLDLGQGQQAQWAADGSYLLLLYFVEAADDYGVVRIDPTTGQRRELLTWPSFGYLYETSASFAQTPDGQWLALAYNRYSEAQGFYLWLFDSTGQLKHELELPGTLGEWPKFSADSRYLAMQLWSEKGTPRTLLYELATQTTRYLDYATLSWSPRDQRLLLADVQGLAVLNSFDGTPERLAWGCQKGVWRP